MNETILPHEIEEEINKRFNVPTTNKDLGFFYFKQRQLFKEGVEWALEVLKQKEKGLDDKVPSPKT